MTYWGFYRFGFSSVGQSARSQAAGDVLITRKRRRVVELSCCGYLAIRPMVLLHYIILGK